MTFLKAKSEQGSTSLITLAFIFPILIFTSLYAIHIFHSMRIVAIMQFATSQAFYAAKSPALLSSADSGDTVYNYLQTDSSQEAPTRISPIYNFDKCKGVPADNVVNECFRRPTSIWQRALSALDSSTDKSPPIMKIWHGYNASQSSDVGSGGGTIEGSYTAQLPWPLYEPHHIDHSFNKVQYLPTVCIRRGCLETYNETGGIISSVGSDSSDNCSQVQPICWFNDVRADFDGDGKEDIVLFRPTGQDAFEPPPGDDPLNHADWLVYHSAANYSGQITGNGLFNLGRERSNANEPEDIPIVADYDRDGLADFAVFQPAEGKVRIAYSSRNFEVVVESAPIAAITDPDGRAGLIAIPGIYSGMPNRRYDLREMQIAVVATGSNAGQLNRYHTTLLTRTKPPDLATIPPGIYTITLDRRIIVDPVRPPPGTQSVPAFADINKDGHTEFGYLSWYGGNPVRRIAGGLDLDVPFQSVSSSAEAKESKVNPFAMTLGANDELYYADSVQGTIWRIDAAGGDTAISGNTESTTPVVNLRAPDNNHVRFPERNVINIPARTPITAPVPMTVTARDYPLNAPRKMAVGPDGAMYVADWGNGALVRFASTSATGKIDPNAAATPILYRTTNPPCTDTDNNLYTLVSSAGATGLRHTGFNRLCFNPIAVAVVPDVTADPASTNYHIAFSDGNAVYLLMRSPISATSGPSGEAGELIFLIGGVSDQPGVTDTLVSNWAGRLFGWNPALAHEICPVVDLDFDLKSLDETNRSYLYAASSCNTARRRGELSANTPPTLPMAGGILKFEITPLLLGTNPLPVGLPPVPQVTMFAGGYHTESDVCGSAAINLISSQTSYSPTTPATIQRKVNIVPQDFYTVLGTSPEASRNILNQNDIYNPVSIQVDPRGNILFINQWNQTSWNCGSGSKRFDNHFVHGIHRINIDTGDIESLTNPYSYGSFTTPIESGMWYSPFADKSKTEEWESLWVTPWDDAPLSLVPLPAVSSLVLTRNKDYMYVGAPYLKSGNWFSGSGGGGASCVPGSPGCVDQSKVGFIHRIFLDTDGDGVSDFRGAASGTDWKNPGVYNDQDIDGDRVSNVAEAKSQFGSMPDKMRSMFCGEIAGGGGGNDYPCRVQERAHLPRMSFSAGRISGTGSGSALGEISIKHPNGIDFLFQSDLPNVVEYPILNSLSPMHDFHRSRQEPLVLLLDTYRNNLLGNLDKNGPIAMPVPLHAFVGRGNCSQSAQGCGAAQAILSYPDSSNLSGTEFKDEFNQFLFPAILGSLAPLPNQIKPVKRASVTGGGIRSGSLCYDYIPPGTIQPSRRQFRSTIIRNFIETFVLLQPSNNVPPDPMDLYSYSAECLNSPDPYTYPQGASTLTRRYATEPIVLHLDTTTLPPSITGKSSTDTLDNHRLFTLIDHDGDNLRNPTWLGREAFLGVTGHTANFGNLITPPQNKPFILATGALRSASDPNATTSYLDNFELGRLPFTYKSLTSPSGFPFNEPGNLGTIFTPNIFRFDSLINPEQAPLFDSGFGNLTLETRRTDGFILALDREPFLNSFVRGESHKYFSTTDKRRTNRFVSFDNNNTLSDLGCDKEAEPGIVPYLAMAIMKRSFYVEGCKFGIPTSEELNDPYFAYVKLIPTQECGIENLDAAKCTGIEIGYNNKAFGTVYTVKNATSF